MPEELSRRAKFRRRRRAECEAYAKEARFWKGKPKTALRMLYDQPINKQALKDIKPKKSY